MARKRTRPRQTPAPPPAERARVTPERFGRLFRLVRFLGEGPKNRDQLTAHLGLDVRGFYRDLEVLRAFGIDYTLEHGQYALKTEAEKSLTMLPYPDPHLTLGEMRSLAKGRTAVHRKMQAQIEKLLP